MAKGLFLIIAVALVATAMAQCPNKCSGHGVCGLSRMSGRSLAATLAFMAAGFASASLIQVAMGGVL